MCTSLAYVSPCTFAERVHTILCGQDSHGSNAGTCGTVYRGVCHEVVLILTEVSTQQCIMEKHRTRLALEVPQVELMVVGYRRRCEVCIGSLPFFELL